MSPIRLKQNWFRILLAATGLYLSLCLLLWLGQTRLIFFPDAVIQSTPADVGLRYQEVDLTVGDGTVRSWWVPTSQTRAPTILYLHGNSSNLGDLVGRALLLHRLGFSVLLIDYRGYGLSRGVFPTEQSVYQDAVAALDYLTQTRQIPPQTIVVMGESLGGAIALATVEQNPQVAAVIVESSFTSMRDMIDYRLPLPIIPVEPLLHQRFDSLSRVQRLQVPILVIHGTADRVVPVRMGKALYEAAALPRHLLLVANAGHDDLPEVGGARYLQTLRQFVHTSITPSN